MADHTLIYARVSTEEQAKDGNSTAAQLEMCRKYVELHGLPSPLLFTDAGVSGSTIDRPELNAARMAIADGHLSIKHLVVFKLDRLTRSVGDLCVLLAELEEHGVALHGVRDKLDTGTASGRLVLHIMGAVAEWERDTIADRVKTGLAHIKGRGYHLGKPPYGWELVSHEGPGSLLMPTADYPHINDSRKAHLNGMSLAGIGSIVKGQRHSQVGRRIVDAPLIEEMLRVEDASGKLVGYKYPV